MNVIGNIAAEEWIKTAEIRPDIELDEWVIMPNHIHGIIFINPSVGARRAVPEMCDPSEFQIAHHTQNINTRPMEQFGKPVSGSIPTIVRAFKSAVTKRTREEIKMPDKKLWQRNYYEHVIRTDEDLNRIREYIICNPMNWELSRDNPAFF